MKPYYLQLASSLCLIAGSAFLGYTLDKFNFFAALAVALLVIGGMLLNEANHNLKK